MKILNWFGAALLATTAFASSVTAAETFDADQKGQIEKIVREYLIQHPEVMIEVQQSLEKKQNEARLAQAQSAVTENHDAIFNASYDLSIGNPKGKVTVVEFFDYNCGYCRRAISDMDAVIKANPDVRFVLKEFPILGEDSVAAHKVSNAFRHIAPEKYGDFHRELLGGEHADERRALEVAASLGVTEKQIREEMAKSSNDASVQETYKLASSLGISGTPSYIVGNEAIFGAVGAFTLDEKIKNVAQCGKTTC